MIRINSILVAWSIAILFAWQSQLSIVRGNQIRYSWNGLLVPNSIDDPWYLGPLGKPFGLEITVAKNAVDLFQENIDVAAYEIVKAEMRLDGEKLLNLNSGVIEFIDGYPGFDHHPSLFDIVIFGGEFQRFGHTFEVGSAVTMPVSTFQFAQFVEQPPYIKAINRVSDRTTCCGGTYAAVVAAGSPLIFVPEPATILLIGMGFIGFAIRRR